jgi:uncharacterized protein
LVSLKQWDRKKYNTENVLIQCLLKFIESININYPCKLQQAILYGSYAKGTWQEDSDVDIALIMDKISINEVIERIVDLAVDLEHEYGFFISPIGININDFNKNCFKPLYKNLRNEGIIIWKRN